MDFNFDPEKLKAEQDEIAAKKRSLNMIGGIGDALASQQSFGNFYLGKMNPQSTTVSKVAGGMADTLEDPMARQAKLFEGYKQASEAKKMKEEQELLARDRDPNSKESQALKALAPRWGIQVTPEMSAYEIKQMIDPRKMMETEAQSRVSFDNQKALEAIRHRNDMEKFKTEKEIQATTKTNEKAEKLELDRKERTTQFGVARTNEDAKALKSAAEIKENFDRKLEEMIQLRTDHNGGAILNREDVARGKQLSKDLLLAYKDMSKLGVLSAADEKILRAIIPDDPLEYNSPLAAIQGQDPTMARLKKFKEDAEKDFQSRLKNRLEVYEGGSTKKYEQDVLDYAKKFNITPDEAQKVKDKRISTPAR